MSRISRMIVGVSLGLLGSAPAAWAQGCILCYTSAAAGGPGVTNALRWGVLTLLIPALSLFIGLGLLVWRRAKAPNYDIASSALLR
jgi:hypothetical protein